MKKRIVYRIASLLIVVTVMVSQLGASFLHTHAGLSTGQTTVVTASPDNGTAPCPACSMEGTPVLPVEILILNAPESVPSDFIAVFPADVLLPHTGTASGRAPPAV
ncbi:MAG: hypothetical protein JNK10_07115 [Cyclobacteriaceae bacterium]|nr:hypothetical protein [Cyclobacteriaceae bacterium]